MLFPDGIARSSSHRGMSASVKFGKFRVHCIFSYVTNPNFIFRGAEDCQSSFCFLRFTPPAFCHTLKRCIAEPNAINISWPTV